MSGPYGPNERGKGGLVEEKGGKKSYKGRL